MKATDIVREALERIRRFNALLVAFVHVDETLALQQAANIDEEIARGRSPGPLAGVPFGVKDIEECAGMPMRSGSLFLMDRPPRERDSPLVARLKAAGAVAVGMTATGEFGLDSGTNTKAFGATRNPWNLALTPGGSSGGSAAAVAAGLVPFCTAADSGGSIRGPAAFTGLVGLKPSHGRVPRPSGGFDVFGCVGTLTTTVRDTARCLDVSAGPHSADRMTLPPPGISYERASQTLTVQGARAVWSSDLGYAAVDPEIIALARAAAERACIAAGVKLIDEPIALPNVYADWIVLAAHSLRAAFESHGLGAEQFEMLSQSPRFALERAGELTAFRVWEAESHIAELEAKVGAILDRFDFIVTPAVACPAFAADELYPQTIGGRSARDSGAEPFGAFVNASWSPAISLPAGFTSNGAPTGVQFTGQRHREDMLLALATAYERAFPWPLHAPLQMKAPTT